MKFTTLISSYLLTDTLKRWLDNCTSPLARVVVGVFFSASAFLAIGAINSAEDKIVYELEALGSHRSNIAVSVAPGDKINEMRFLDRVGEVISFSAIPVSGRTEHGRNLKVLAITDGDHSRLVKQFPTLSIGKPIVASSDLEGIEYDQLRISISNFEVIASVWSDPPSELMSIFSESVIIPHSEIPQFENLAYQRQYIVESFDPSHVEAVLSEWISLEGYQPSDFTYTDANQLLAKLATFQRNKALALLGMSLSIGAILVVVFSACSILEFKQSVFIITLMRSFGIPSFFLFLQRLAENAILMLLSFGLGLGIALLLAVSDLPIRDWILYNEKGFSAMVIIVVSGAASALFATLPILLSLRSDPGRMLK